MCLKKMEANIMKNMNMCTIKLIKLTTFFFALFLVAVWPWFRKLVLNIGWVWLLVITVVLMAIVMKKTCKGKTGGKKCKGKKK